MNAKALSVCLAVLAIGPPAAAAAQDPANGFPVLVPPAVMVRDGEGRVTVRAIRVDEPPRVDARNIYIAARCRDSQPSRIVANDMRRDGRNVSQNDNISVALDTFHDGRNGYEFLMNSIGGAWDTQITDERDANRDWNTPWVPRSRQDAEGWTVEMAIPFRSLRYRGSGPQIWGINIRRNVRWKNELSFLSPVPRQYGARGILRLSQAATLVGLEAPPSALNLDVKPYAVGSVVADRTIDPAFENEIEPNAGFDVKYGVAQSMTGDFTYRTDFAQVEDDDLQVNLTRFNLFYPEKRDFFLEGQGIFAFGGAQAAPSTSGAAASAPPSNTPVLFFSRRIGLNENRVVPIEAGGRLTGKAGRYSIGLLDIQTDDSPEANAAPTNFAVVRVKRDILRRSNIGFIATRRDPTTLADGVNTVFGVDANLSFYQSLNIVGYYAGTRTPDRRGDDRSYRARFDYDADLFGLQVEHLAAERNFRPEIGFMRREDFIESLAQVRVSRRPQLGSAVRKYNYEAALDYITNNERQLENRQFRTGLRTDMQSGDAWSVMYFRDFEFLAEPFEIVADMLVPAGAYHSSTIRASYTVGTQRRISGDISVARGGFYDGDRTDLSYRGRAELTSRLSIEPGISFNWVDLPTDSFTATLLTTRATFSFTPRMLTAALIQYNSTSNLITTNVRFRWEYRPLSELFVVYSDGRDTLTPGFPDLLNRGVTVKLTRLFRF